jgi:hypothetical protein
MPSKVRKQKKNSSKSKSSVTGKFADSNEFSLYKDRLVEHIAGQEVWTKSVDERLDRMEVCYTEVIPELKVKMDILSKGIPDIQAQIEKHTDDGDKVWANISKEISKLTTSVDSISNDLNHIQLNGNVIGFKQGIKELYIAVGLNKVAIDELRVLTEATRLFTNMKISLIAWTKTSMIVRFFKSRFGQLVGFVILAGLLNTLLESIGIDFNIWSVVKKLF